MAKRVGVVDRRGHGAELQHLPHQRIVDGVHLVEIHRAAKDRVEIAALGLDHHAGEDHRAAAHSSASPDGHVVVFGGVHHTAEAIETGRVSRDHLGAGAVPEGPSVGHRVAREDVALPIHGPLRAALEHRDLLARLRQAQGRHRPAKPRADHQIGGVGGRARNFVEQFRHEQFVSEQLQCGRVRLRLRWHGPQTSQCARPHGGQYLTTCRHDEEFPSRCDVGSNAHHTSAQCEVVSKIENTFKNASAYYRFRPWLTQSVFSRCDASKSPHTPSNDSVDLPFAKRSAGLSSWRRLASLGAFGLSFAVQWDGACADPAA
ncbi:hypothetical protein SDC9_79082 [bioreactor metagenome]|uniref:Uncharacterized protein n=1 Tax=bioreactor metagenome TaxID=1076179 RepID=A0A644YW20_9ZZZZ